MTRRRKVLITPFVVLSLLALLPSSPADATPRTASRACAGVSDDNPPDRRGGDAPLRSHVLLTYCLGINQIQVLGSHNSYKKVVTPEIMSLLLAFDRGLGESLQYAHQPFDTQFSDQGIRQIELDVFADPEGGLYAGRIGNDIANLPNEPVPELLEPGLKTLHAQDLDFNTHCLSFVECLRQVEDWSRAHRGHLPITILVELKQDPLPDPGFGFVVPLEFDAAELDNLDQEIRSVFSSRQLITPDDVRGSHPTLEAAVLDGNWPSLRASRDKVMFVMDNGGGVRDRYRDGRPSLEGRVLFTNANPGDADAAFVKRNNPIGHVEEIQDLVAAGYVVRTRADEPTIQARNGDTTMQEAAFESGAQWVSTDYPVLGTSPFSDYFASIPGGEPARCNPINTGPRCNDGLLEKLKTRGR